MRIFGPRRVNEYLLSVLEWGTDCKKAGAVNALYWASVALRFHGSVPSYRLEDATEESRATYESLADLWERRGTLFLKTFVLNSSLEVQRSIIGMLSFDEADYPDAVRPLVARAIQMARGHSDDYIRHRAGGDGTLSPLPHRERTR